MEIYIAAISALTALVAVIVGPLVSLHIAKRQFRVSLDIAKQQFRVSLDIANQQFNASVLSVSRQEWINTLRDQISVLVVDTILLRQEVKQYQQEPGRLFARAEGVLRCAFKIKLLINPKEADHVHLVESIDRLMILVVKSADKAAEKVEDKDIDSKFLVIRDEIVSKSQEILKREWKRVKEGK